MTARWGSALGLMLAALLLVVPVALAQSTGSSAGGGSWGSSSSSSSSGGYSGSSSSSSSASYGSSSSGGGSTDVYEPPMHIQLLIAGAFFLFLYVVWRVFFKATAPLGIDLVKLQIAVDSRSRRFVQEALERVASESDMETHVGRRSLLDAASQTLESAKLAWIYAGVKNFSPMPDAEAQAKHTQLAVAGGRGSRPSCFATRTGRSRRVRRQSCLRAHTRARVSCSSRSSSPRASRSRTSTSRRKGRSSCC